jgi:FkbM family methyltransferase
VGIERTLRNLVVRTPLAESKIVGGLYARLNAVRFSRSWDEPVAFRGARFLIGRDLGLYPFVRAGGFEERELDWLLPRLRKDDVVWDVGANVGIYSVLMARRVARVVAFEPVAATLEKLRRNLELNESSNVTVVSAALSDVSGEATMTTMVGGAGGNHLLRGGERGDVSVRVTTGDDYVADHGVPDVIKVDIEGFEPHFVRGAIGVIRDHTPLLTLEVNSTTMLVESDRVEWRKMIDSLFEIYGTALWFGGTGQPVRVTTLSLEGLPQRPCTLAFGTRD